MKRPRFSLRTLGIVVTLVCAYLATWQATKKYGIANVIKTFDISEDVLFTPVPFIIHERSLTSVSAGDSSPYGKIVWRDGWKHRTFLWCGFIYQIPYEYDELDDAGGNGLRTDNNLLR
jgi:hypothetical protein